MKREKLIGILIFSRIFPYLRLPFFFSISSVLISIITSSFRDHLCNNCKPPSSFKQTHKYCLRETLTCAKRYGLTLMTKLIFVYILCWCTNTTCRHQRKTIAGFLTFNLTVKGARPPFCIGGIETQLEFLLISC